MVGVGYVYCLQKIVFTPIETSERSDQIVLRSTCMFGMDFRRSPSQPINHIYINTEVLEVMLYGCVTWTLSPGDFDKLREAHRGMLLRCLNAYTSTRAAPDYHMLSYLEVLLRTDCECIEATVMKRILHYAGRVARMHDDRLPNIVMRGEMVGGKRKRGQPAKRLEHRVTEYCTAFGIDPKCWMRAAQDAPEWYRKVETGAEVFMSAWSTKRVNETNARHAKELFATLPFELP